MSAVAWVLWRKLAVDGMGEMGCGGKGEVEALVVGEVGDGGAGEGTEEVVGDEGGEVDVGKGFFRRSSGGWGKERRLERVVR